MEVIPGIDAWPDGIGDGETGRLGLRGPGQFGHLAIRRPASGDSQASQNGKKQTPPTSSHIEQKHKHPAWIRTIAPAIQPSTANRTRMRSFGALGWLVSNNTLPHFAVSEPR